MDILQNILKTAAVCFIFTAAFPLIIGKAKPYQFCISVGLASFIAGATLEFGITQVALAALFAIAVLSAFISLFNAFIFLTRNNETQPTDYITTETLSRWRRMVWELEN
jgi:hypothetical protein